MTPFIPEPANTNGRRKTISDIFREALNAHAQPTISIGDIADILGPRGYGVLIVFLNLPNLIPAPLPGLSTIFGIPIALIATQLMLGMKTPWLPAIVRNRALPTDKIRHLFDRAEPYLDKLERVLKPRWFPFTTRWTWHFYGLMMLIMAGVMALPIPLGNLVLAVPITLMAIGLIERDGLLLVASTIMGYFALGWNLAIAGGIFYAIWEGAHALFN